MADELGGDDGWLLYPFLLPRLDWAQWTAAAACANDQQIAAYMQAMVLFAPNLDAYWRMSPQYWPPDTEYSYNFGIPINSRRVPYPTINDPRTNKPIFFPRDPQKVDESLRVQWDSTSDRAKFIRQWHEMGYSEPAGGWELYDIHHIRPREYGGGNDFWNLVPVLRPIHQDVLNSWWKAYRP